MLAHGQDLFPVPWVRGNRWGWLKVGPAGGGMAKRTSWTTGTSFRFEIVFTDLVVYHVNQTESAAGS